MGPEQIEMPSLIDAAETWLNDSVPPTSAEQAPVSETYPYKFEIDETDRQLEDQDQQGVGRQYGG